MDWKTIDRTERDKEQTLLSPNGCIPNNANYAKKEDNANLDLIVVCPFCLDDFPLWKFNKKHGLRICPTCKNQMKQETLTRKMTVADFAKWVFDYRLTGFWNKVFPDVPTWCNKLYHSGISYEFWENYKRMRGDYKDRQEWEKEENK